MTGLPERILKCAEARTGDTPIEAGDLLHLGDGAAVNRSLSRLACSEWLLRICRGLHMRPIRTRFGLRAPRGEKALSALSELWDETIVPNGGYAANWLGLTTKTTVRSAYLTSGPDRLLHFGAQRVELRHAPRWKLAAPNRNADTVIRGVAWLGPNRVEESLDAVLPELSMEDLSEPVAARTTMPTWESESLGRRLANC